MLRVNVAKAIFANDFILPLKLFKVRKLLDFLGRLVFIGGKTI